MDSDDDYLYDASDSGNESPEAEESEDDEEDIMSITGEIPGSLKESFLIVNFVLGNLLKNDFMLNPSKSQKGY